MGLGYAYKDYRAVSGELEGAGDGRLTVFFDAAVGFALVVLDGHGVPAEALRDFFDRHPCVEQGEACRDAVGVGADACDVAAEEVILIGVGLLDDVAHHLDDVR